MTDPVQGSAHPVADSSALRATAELFLQGSGLIELRALQVPTARGLRTLSGYYSNADRFAEDAAALSDKGAFGVYLTINPLKGLPPGATVNEARVAASGSLTKDVDVQSSRWLFIDVDPLRPKRTSATASERTGAAVVVKRIQGFLSKQGWAAPVVADSGNGFHLLYQLEQAPKPCTELIKGALSVLAFLFDTEEATVDTSVYNPARICKAYGTAARKGTHTELRPHRASRLGSVPAPLQSTPLVKLTELAETLPGVGEDRTAPIGQLDTYIADEFPKAQGPAQWGNQGRRWVFQVCPWDASHTDSSAYILQFAGGGIAAGCLHESCEGAQKTKDGKAAGWRLLQKKASQTFAASTGAAALPVAGSTAWSPNLTDLGNARRMVNLFGQDLLFCASQGGWFTYEGSRWARDQDGAVQRRAKLTVASIFAEAAAATDTDWQRRLRKHGVKSESAGALAALVQVAETEAEVAVPPGSMDTDPWLFNCQNGTLDLRTGELHPPDRGDLITKMSPVEWDPTAECPVWDQFLETVMAGDPEVIRFIYRFFGYCLTGLCTEQVLLFMEGTGQNGKTTAMLTVMHIMGDYAIQGAPGLLMKKRASSHPTEIADLQGVRFVANAEVDKGTPFAESLIKQLTGSDRVRARRMRQDFYEFDPTHKLVIAANHRPIIVGNDAGIWRRMVRLRWDVHIPDKDKDPLLLDKLKAEAPGILAKLWKGCAEWQQQGLQPPPSVQMATGEYRAEMDVLAEFIEDCCVVRGDASVGKKQLYLAYCGWCEALMQRASKYALFNRQISERGYSSGPRKRLVRGVRVSMRVWFGIGVKATGSTSPNRAQA